ncbi:hypothetical protein FOXB_15839 [Fusarium oxysporum f. sp. conglutinans Fo5176]|uniref:Uncharacterized protein n=1 Tax=Fusarium oxysporum (strain Fo5176) TaxID=660025 RepID=F9GB06_FUSOF|nr:hypothetical protein FOXB_15839 [Fusarium oxysporum f. sp. conglutinans Fo5176]
MKCQIELKVRIKDKEKSTLIKAEILPKKLITLSYYAITHNLTRELAR